jgi:tetratricopeptide (TPR) repeat protein
VDAVTALLEREGNDNPLTGINQAIQFVQDGDVKTGFELHVRSVKKYPQISAAWYNFGVTMHRMKQLNAAVDCYSRAIELDKKAILSRVYRGAIRARRGEDTLAREDWQAAITSDPQHVYSKMVQVILPYSFTGPLFIQCLDQIESSLRYMI